MSYEDNAELGIEVVVPKETEEDFEFDWPSEEIKAACQELLATDKECFLPVLKFIAKENVANTNGKTRREDTMEDVQHH